MAAQDREAPSRRTQLRDLVRERKEALKVGYEKLAQRCIDPESGEQTVKGSWLHRLATDEPVQPPELPALRGLAAGLDVPLAQVQDAASAEFFGVDQVWPKSAKGRAFIEDADRLAPEQREAIHRLIRSLVDGE